MLTYIDNREDRRDALAVGVIPSSNGRINIDYTIQYSFIVQL